MRAGVRTCSGGGDIKRTGQRVANAVGIQTPKASGSQKKNTAEDPNPKKDAGVGRK